MKCITVGLILLGLYALTGCGGGSSSSNATSTINSASSSSGGGSSSSGNSSSSSSGGASNMVAVIVGPGPPAANGGTFNIPYASVTVCIAGTGTCATIDNVLVDTGSSGLRLMATALQAAGLNLPTEPDPANSGNTLAECLPFADGYTWGPLASVDVVMGGETARGISINIIDDRHTFTATPSSCASTGMNTSLNSVTAFDSNGVLGVGVFDQDCGTSCAECASFGGCTTNSDIYYSCSNTGNQCSLTQVALASQVRNPVALFAVDNNGVVLQLQSVPPGGQTTASGTLIFGIATQANNALGSAKVLTADNMGNLITMFDSQTLSSSFFDSGSNGLYFPDSSIPPCTNTQTDPTASDFYCPNSPLQLQATNQGLNGTMSPVSFEIISVNSINDNFYAVPTIGGPANSNQSLGTDYFDWGLPFFYGRSVYTAIEGKSAGGTTGPYYAY